MAAAAVGLVAAEELPDAAESEEIADVSARQATAARNLLSLDLDYPQACCPTRRVSTARTHQSSRQDLSGLTGHHAGVRGASDQRQLV